MSSVCRVCLAGNTTLHSLKNNQLKEIYEKLSNTKFNSEDARPKGLCRFCYRKLLRCHTFSQMAHRSEKIFNHLYDKGLEANQKNIAEVHLEMKQHLSVGTIQLLDNDDNTTEDSQVTIKYEPSLVDIKEEMTTEQDKWVEFQSLPEESTKSQLILADDNNRGNDVEELPCISHVEQRSSDDSKITFSYNYNKIFLQKSKLISQISNSHSQLKGNQYLYSHTKQHSEKTDNIEGKIIYHRKKPFACHECDKQFNQKCSLDIHMRIHTGEKPFSCNLCDKQFNQKGSLDNHIRTHTGEKPFACNLCDKQFNQNSNLDRHKRTHTGEKPFTCNECEKQFNQKGSLEKHMRIHTGKKPFVCNVCEKRYNQNAHLVRHMRTHTRTKPFECNECNKQFNQKESLDKHMRIHTGKMPFACSVCEKRYNENAHLARHMKTHTGTKPFVCNTCDKEFYEKFNLLRHIRIHTRVKAFACNVCHKQFVKKSAQNRHIKSSHERKKN